MTPAERRAHENRAIAALDAREKQGQRNDLASREAKSQKSAEETAALVGVEGLPNLSRGTARLPRGEGRGRLVEGLLRRQEGPVQAAVEAAPGGTG